MIRDKNMGGNGRPLSNDPGDPAMSLKNSPLKRDSGPHSSSPKRVKSSNSVASPPDASSRSQTSSPYPLSPTSAADDERTETLASLVSGASAANTFVPPRQPRHQLEQPGTEPYQFRGAEPEKLLGNNDQQQEFQFPVDTTHMSATEDDAGSKYANIHTHRPGTGPAPSGAEPKATRATGETKAAASPAPIGSTMATSTSQSPRNIPPVTSSVQKPSVQSLSPNIRGRGNPPGRAFSLSAAQKQQQQQQPQYKQNRRNQHARQQSQNTNQTNASFLPSNHDRPPHVQGTTTTSTLETNARYPGIQLQPETRPISLPQLVNEVKGIYVGLVMVESKCIEIDNEQGPNGDALKNLDDEQWQALLALHRTLLHEHHDFMLASQHPSASPALRRVAQKYAMPARMWRHGIHSFLELLRHRLPASREHMETFIYMAYSMMALLYETVPAFEDTWVECLGDLSRYRMAIEDDNQRVRDTWTSVSRHWYTVASDRAPTTGRLAHHLAILARPHIVTQLFFYIKSLCVPIPFTSTRESILTLLEPVLNGVAQRVAPADLAFTTLHALLFLQSNKTAAAGRRPDAAPQFVPTLARLPDMLDRHIANAAKNFIEAGAHMAIVTCCAFLEYGADGNALVKILRDVVSSAGGGKSIGTSTVKKETAISKAATEDTSMEDSTASEPQPVAADPQVVATLEQAQQVATAIDRVAFERFTDSNCYGYIHIRLVFMTFMAQLPQAMVYLEHDFAWEDLAVCLNHLLLSYTDYDKIEAEVLMEPTPTPEVQMALITDDGKEGKSKDNKDKTTIPMDVVGAPPLVITAPAPTSAVLSGPAPASGTKPLPEDWILRGLLWTDRFFPHSWFTHDDMMDDEERLMESASTPLLRKERILWLACRLAAHKKWLLYDAEAHQFSVAEPFKNKSVVETDDMEEEEEEDDDDETADFDEPMLDGDEENNDGDEDIDLSGMEALAEANMAEFEHNVQTGNIPPI